MDDRAAISRELTALEALLKELEIGYEQYFTGVEKREPSKKRDNVASRLRFLANRRITQTDLRFRLQNLATRYHSLAGHWDRILRLMDEGKYFRQKSRIKTAASSPAEAGSKTSPARPASADDGLESLYRDFLSARQSCKLDGPAPDKAQIAAFIDKQKAMIQEKFGDRQVEFRVVTEEGKPKIKVRAKP